MADSDVTSSVVGGGMAGTGGVRYRGEVGINRQAMPLPAGVAGTSE